MTEAEVSALVIDMAARWPHQKAQLVGDDVVKRYATDLAGLEPEPVGAAVESWYRDGQRFAPSGAQIIGHYAALVIDAPEWWQVKAALTGQASVPDGAPELPDDCPYGVCDGDGWEVDVETNTASHCRCRSGRLAIKRLRKGKHPMVAEFIAYVGASEIGDIEGDRTAESQVREKYQAWVRGLLREATHQGIDTAGLPALERLQGRRGGQLGRVDPVAALGLGRAA